MKKEEILEKSRKENKDEYIEKIISDSKNSEIITLTIAIIFFAVTKVINNGQPFFKLPAILFAYTAGINFFSYVKLKKKEYLISSFSFIFAFICMTVLYFINW